MALYDPHCDRCKQVAMHTTMSKFNTEQICMPCNEQEKRHPDFEAARKAEAKEVARHNYNFPGVGLPEGYESWRLTEKLEMPNV